MRNLSITLDAAYTCIFEIMEDSKTKEPLRKRKFPGLQSTIEKVVARKRKEDDDLMIVSTEHSIIVTVFNNGKLLFEIVLESQKELDQYNQSRSPDEQLALRMGIDSVQKSSLMAQQNELTIGGKDVIREAMVTSSVSKAQQLVIFGDSGHILISKNFSEVVIIPESLGRYVYFGRYQLPKRGQMELWGFCDPSNQIGNVNPPAAMRVEDEDRIAVYAPPYIKLCKPRPISPEKVRELATHEVKILVLSPHPNDIPWGCAGTLLWFKELFDARIYLHFLTSTRNPHVTGDPRYGPTTRDLSPALWSYGILTGEDPAALKTKIDGDRLSEDDAFRKIVGKIPRLGSTPHQIYVEGHILDPSLDSPPMGPEGSTFKDGSLDIYQSFLRDRLSWLETQISPDIVLCPSLKDTHQDHRAVAEAAMAIFKCQESIWFYELPHASRNPYYYFTPNLFIDVSSYAECKISLLKTCYEYDIKRFHFSPDGARALMQVRAIEAYYERPNWSRPEAPVSPNVEAFETRLYFR